MAAIETFASSLLGDNGHEALVKLSDGEIKALEHVKAYLVKQIHITEQFFNSMTKLNSSNVIQKADFDADSPFAQTWQLFYSENINILAVLNQFTSVFTSSILPRLDTLLSHCKEVQKEYKTQRFRVDSEFKTTCNEEQRLRTTYHQHAREVESARLKLEASKSGSKGSDKSKGEKFLKASLKLYQNHNDYVLALTAATIHQRHYQDSIVPTMLNSLQTVKQDLVKEWKDILNDLIGYIKTYGEQNIKFSEAMYSSLTSITDDNPYEKFIENKRQNPPSYPVYIFDEALLKVTNTDLVADEVGLNDLTFEQLKAKNTLLQQSVNQAKSTLGVKSSEYQKAKQRLAELMERSERYRSMFYEQMAVSELSRELKELNCTHEKAVAQHETISSTLEKLNGGLPRRFSSSLISRSDDSFGPAETRRSGRTLKDLKRLKDNVINFAKKPHSPGNSYSEISVSSSGSSSVSPTGGNSVSPSNIDGSRHNRPLPTAPTEDDDNEVYDYDEPVETPLEQELWYHGTISRGEAELLVQNNGDYLVRESSRKPGQYVLSSRWDSARHFIIQQDETGKFRLEGESFPTVTHLIDYHRKHRIPVTRKSNALLKNPILRPNANRKTLTRDDFIITTKLGSGHFGDVMKGRLSATKEEVAIKTCRENVSTAMREKFLQEAEILGQYDHPNIVKLIGVAIDKEVVYIVMELMAGGDFLKYLREQGSHILPAQLLQFAIDAASGMQYLESKGCIHRDLAARNCLLDKVKILKISDFGMSRETDLYECSNMREIPVKWTAPEALNYSQYTSQSDVWSFGVLLWETFSLGNTPYPGMSNKETREKVDRGYVMPTPLGTPDVVYRLMQDCWTIEPDNRPRFGEIVRRLGQIKDAS